MAPYAPTPATLHGTPLFQTIRDMASRSLADAAKNSDVYSKAYQKEVQRLIAQCDAAGAKSPRQRMDELQTGEGDDAAFSDPRHAELLAKTTTGRSILEERRRKKD
jgi:hypothetical protein